MNLPQPLLRLCTFGCGILLLLTPLRTVCGGAIPPEIKSGPDADKLQQRTLIVAFVKAQVEALGGDDADKRGKARDAIINEVNPIGKVVLNPTFLDVYAQEIDKQLTPLATNADVKVRLNVAIAVARVAEKCENSRMLGIVEVLLEDKSEAVLIWAVRAAGYVLPPLLQAGVPQQQQKLIARIKEHGKNKILIASVYDALTMNYSDWKGTPPNLNKTVPLVVPELLNLMQARSEMLRQGDLPEQSAERTAANFLVDSRVWKQYTKAQPLQVVQVLLNFWSYAGHRAALPGAERDQMILLVRGAGLALGVAAQNAGDPTATNFFQPFRNIDPSAPNFLQTIDSVYPRLQQVPALKALKAPAKIEQGAAGTQPATAPAATSAPAPASKQP